MLAIPLVAVIVLIMAVPGSANLLMFWLMGIYGLL